MSSGVANARVRMSAWSVSPVIQVGSSWTRTRPTAAAGIRTLKVSNAPDCSHPIRGFERQQCSVRSRSLLASVLTLNGTKQSLGLTTGVTTNGGCTRYSGRRHQAVRSAARQRPLLYSSNSRYRPNPDRQASPRLPDARPGSVALRGHEAAVHGHREPARSGHWRPAALLPSALLASDVSHDIEWTTV